jgi:uncharacterized protein (TIGR03382 family)
VPGNGRSTPFPSTRQGYALIATGDFDGVCYDGPCGGAQEDGGEDGEDAQDADDAGIGPDNPVFGDDAGGDPGSDPGGGDDGRADAGGAGDDGGGVEGSCGCSGDEYGGSSLLWFLMVSILWRRRRNS